MVPLQFFISLYFKNLLVFTTQYKFTTFIDSISFSSPVSLFFFFLLSLVAAEKARNSQEPKAIMKSASTSSLWQRSDSQMNKFDTAYGNLKLKDDTSETERKNEHTKRQTWNVANAHIIISCFFPHTKT